MTISITSRIRNALVGLTVVMCVFFTGLIFLLVYIIEDEVLLNQVKIEQASFERVVTNGGAKQAREWQPSNANMKRLDSLISMVDVLPSNIIADVLEQRGIHEYFDDQQAMFIAHELRADNAKPYFLIYEVKDLLAVRGSKRALLILIGALSLLITIVAIVLAGKLTRATLSPLSRLSDALKNDDLDDVVIKLAKEFSPDEIGLLAGELAQSLEKARASSQREYEFNRGVSHELRSPIQVAQSTAELLQLYVSEHDSQIAKPVARLQRAVTEMNEVADAFLWLASERVVEHGEVCSVADLKRTLDAVQSTFRNQKINIEIQSSWPVSYALPKSVLSVMLRSLVRNAITHGELAPITVALNAESITVTNAVNHTADRTRGFGIGLSIVQRMCDRFGCELNILGVNESQYSASIAFTV
jgi:signal transduction histidine kinase